MIKDDIFNFLVKLPPDFKNIFCELHEIIKHLRYGQ